MASGALAVDAKMFWTQLEGSKVDLIFEQIQKVLLSLKKKIKDGTATNEEYCQALALVDQVDVTDFLPLKNVNVAKENIQKCKPGFHPLASSEIKENPGDDFSLTFTATPASDEKKGRTECHQHTNDSSAHTF
ncbi:Histone-lysine N-methyltransferase SETDB2 [Varanus komodoensis]|nr:Histone-lysine N-methyltransferase SETDB2 [Varanus komodoensis]